VLFLVRTQGGTPEDTAVADRLVLQHILEEAKVLSLPVVTPLGDMDDMSHLNWEQAVAGDPALRQWAHARYGAQVWAVAVQLTTDDSGAKPAGYTLRAEMLGGTPELTATATSGPASGPWRAEVTSAAPPGRCVDSGEVRRCPYALLARALLQQVADQWVQTHTINPAKRHTLFLRVVHGPKLAQFSQFATRLRSAPGVASLKFVEERATESVIQLEFQGEDAQLAGMLGQLGGHLEAESGTPPPGESTAPPARVERVVRLP
ncbi:MAG: DUF2066 domain-containing protein, partial [Magnetococcus sp. DMHC-8]